MPGIDLHSHSTRSDGLLTPAELVARAVAGGVRTLALTDHDELGGLGEAHAAAAVHGIEFVNGVEISVTWASHTLHVVGLHVDPRNVELAGGLEAIRSGRLRRAERIAAELDQCGIDGGLEGARVHAVNPQLVGRTHFARFLVERGHGRDIQAVFKKFLAKGKPGYVPHVWADLGQAMHWIKASGGLPVLAHPGRYGLDETERETLLARFVDLGGIAVEVVTGSHTPAQFAVWAAHARRFGLLASAGSDFHGPRESRREPGDLPDLPAGCTPVWERF